VLYYLRIGELLGEAPVGIYLSFGLDGFIRHLFCGESLVVETSPENKVYGIAGNYPIEVSSIPVPAGGERRGRAELDCYNLGATKMSPHRGTLLW